MLTMKRRSSPLTPVRARSPHSMMIAASKSTSTDEAIRISGTPGNCSSGPGARSTLMTSNDLPISRSAYAMASCDPIESPSGRAWDEMTKRCRARIASAMRWRSGSGFASIVAGVAAIPVVAGVQLVEQLLDAILAGNRLVVDELQVGYAAQPQPRSDLPTQEGRGAFERPCRGALRLRFSAGRSERRVVHTRVLQIRRHLDARDRHEADARVVHLAREELAQLASNLIRYPVGSGALRHRQSTIVNLQFTK